jgi:hypothetical protein
MNDDPPVYNLPCPHDRRKVFGRAVWVDVSVTYIHNLCRDCWTALAAAEAVGGHRRWQRETGSTDFYADGRTMRTLLCDFCGIELRANWVWEFEADDFEYDGPRETPDGTLIEGSQGGWLACEDCTPLVRDGKREELAVRTVERVLTMVPVADRGESRKRLLDEIRRLQDRFWSRRRGRERRLRPGEFKKLQREPAYDVEWR